jgi:hypothetical protein
MYEAINAMATTAGGAMLATPAPPDPGFPLLSVVVLVGILAVAAWHPVRRLRHWAA